MLIIRYLGYRGVILCRCIAQGESLLHLVTEAVVFKKRRCGILGTVSCILVLLHHLSFSIILRVRIDEASEDTSLCRQKDRKNTWNTGICLQNSMNTANVLSVFCLLLFIRRL